MTIACDYPSDTLRSRYRGPRPINAAVNHATLGLTPYLSNNNDIIWVCGNHASPGDGASLPTGETAGATSVKDKHMPQTCRT